MKKHWVKVIFVLSLIAATAYFIPNDAWAQQKNTKKQPAKQTQKTSQNPRYASIIVNADNGTVIFEDNADKPRYPASLTKMMTVYLAFEAIKSGKLSLDQKVPVSGHASEQSPLKLNLIRGDTISIRKLIESIVVRSANDSAVVLAEAVGGSEERFASIMTKRARDLGMSRTTFRNASGLPDPQQITTARDLAKLSIALRRDFPEYYPLFKTNEFTWKGKSYLTHNRVTRNYPGAEGLKTGFIRASGFNLATSVSRDGYHIVGIVMGGSTAKSRDVHMIALLDKSLVKLASIDGRDSSKYIAQASSNLRKNAVKYSEDEIASNIPENMGGDFPDASSLSSASGKPTAKQVIKEAQIINDWAIQIGAFTDPKEALMAAAHAGDVAGSALIGSEIKVKTDKGNIHRAHIVNLSKEQAFNACKTITARNENCFVLKVN